MRRVLVDHARTQLGPQRGGGVQHIPLESALAIGRTAPESLVALDDALLSLERLDPRKGRLVEMRLYGGPTNDEAAQILGVSSRTVMRDWDFAKGWIARELNYPPSESE